MPGRSQRHKKPNYRYQHQRALKNIGREVHFEQRNNGSWQSYDVGLFRFCEIGVKIHNLDCNTRAYRKVSARYGDRWTCDSCSQLLCKDLAELNLYR